MNFKYAFNNIYSYLVQLFFGGVVLLHYQLFLVTAEHGQVWFLIIAIFCPPFFEHLQPHFVDVVQHLLFCALQLDAVRHIFCNNDLLVGVLDTGFSSGSLRDFSFDSGHLLVEGVIRTHHRVRPVGQFFHRLSLVVRHRAQRGQLTAVRLESLSHRGNAATFQGFSSESLAVVCLFGRRWELVHVLGAHGFPS
jgi:hypothetical protein